MMRCINWVKFLTTFIARCSRHIDILWYTRRASRVTLATLFSRNRFQQRNSPQPLTDRRPCLPILSSRSPPQVTNSEPVRPDMTVTCQSKSIRRSRSEDQKTHPGSVTCGRWRNGYTLHSIRIQPTRGIRTITRRNKTVPNNML